MAEICRWHCAVKAARRSNGRLARANGEPPHPMPVSSALLSLLIFAPAVAAKRWDIRKMRALSLDEANTIIAATFVAAKKHKCRPMSAIVLDAGGRVKAFQKEDNASMLRFEVCYGKAYASLALGRPSKLVLQKADEKPLFMRSVENLADYPLFLEGGGQLIRDKSGEVVAAIGVTGDANEMDDICAIAGIHAAGYRADSDFFKDPERMRSLSIHKSAPLVDPRPNAARTKAARTERRPAGQGDNGARVPANGSSRSRGT